MEEDTKELAGNVLHCTRFSEILKSSALKSTASISIHYSSEEEVIAASTLIHCWPDIAVYCSVLQYTAVYCSVLTAVYCSVLQCTAV